jgi:hypothetical protein
VTAEIIVLALLTAVRPTSLAAVYALLSAESPRRLMVVYVASGMVFTIAIGFLVVLAFDGIDVHTGSSHTKAVAQLAGGIVVLVFAVGVLTRRVGGRQAEDAPKPNRRWERLLNHRPTGRTAALAGPATHVPGLFYLVALNLIVAHRGHPIEGLVQVLIYNVVWFVIPIAALATCVVRPATARDAVEAIQAWTKRHARAIVLAVSFGVGAVLVVRGLVAI